MILLLSYPTLEASARLPEGKVLWQSANGLSLRALSGAEAKAYLEPIAKMRMRFFREFPYLYEGSLDYEKNYLETYFGSPNSAVLLVFKENTIVGFSNIIPLNEELEEIQAAFKENDLPVEDYLYIGEVILDPICRNQGLSRRFFDFHESYAQERGYSKLVFMTVKRPTNHPQRPKNYRPLEPIWRHFGYELLPGVAVKIPWKQVDTQEEEPNTLDVWFKELNALAE